MGLVSRNLFAREGVPLLAAAGQNGSVRASLSFNNNLALLTVTGTQNTRLYFTESLPVRGGGTTVYLGSRVGWLACQIILDGASDNSEQHHVEHCCRSTKTGIGRKCLQSASAKF